MRLDRSPQFLTTLEGRVDPAHAAVLVIDMQNDYVSIGGATHLRDGTVDAQQAIVRPLAALLSGARSAGVLVVYLQMTTNPDFRMDSEIEYLRRRHRWNDTLIAAEGTWGQAIIDDLPQPGDVVIEKHRSSGFIGTGLDVALRSNGIRSTIVTGVVTNGCVNSTAREALSHDYYVTLVRDCVAGYNRDAPRRGQSSC